ncbi:MAG TPA: hypothetical protein VEB40_00935 [Flavipsychrobacter sp.]|nr:hypothetical protein [Flavipsychrobacter sp.]
MTSRDTQLYSIMDVILSWVKQEKGNRTASTLYMKALADSYNDCSKILCTPVINQI